MSSTFPLYNILKDSLQINSQDLTNIQKESIIYMIEKDSNCHEIICALIRSYQIDDENKEYLPYECKKQKNGYKFNINKLPSKLQKILYEFTIKHQDELDHESNIKRFDQNSEG